MPLVSLIAEGVGPFKSLELDLSNGRGEPHLGPHILAGVNGSGKSTVLRTIAWVLDRGQCGFPHDEWQQMLRGHETSRALLAMRPHGLHPIVWACSKGSGDGVKESLEVWARRSASRVAGESSMIEPAVEIGPRMGAAPGQLTRNRRGHGLRPASGPDNTWIRFPQLDAPANLPGGRLFNYAAYSPSRALRHLSAPDLSAAFPEPSSDCLAFESTVQNEAIQSWLLSLYSKRAIARDSGQTGEKYTQSLERFEAALSKICNQRVSFDVDIEPQLQPCIRMSGHRLNFSQLPDGVRSTIAWVADFMMREDLVEWDPALAGRRPGVLLLDEVDVHLHPIWQRRVLPAMREALPDVQIIATSHSPFVISSCPNSKVHVLDLDANGEAHVRPPVDAPIGDSVMTTLKGIFGVDSRFDILTERELNEWDELKRHEVTGDLPSKGKDRLNLLTTRLSERSEELRALVAAPRQMPKALLDDLLGTNRPAGKPGRNRRVRA